MSITNPLKKRGNDNNHDIMSKLDKRKGKTVDILTEPTKELTELDKLEPLRENPSRVLVMVLAGESPTSAYRQVYGCTANAAEQASSRLMKNERFKLHLTRKREELATASKLSHVWVMDKLKGIVKDCLDKGKSFNPGVATRALELIGKHLGTFEPKVKDLENRPVFVGISINMGDKPSVEVIRDKTKLPSRVTPAIKAEETSNDTTT